jgi:hypothetical protein
MPLSAVIAGAQSLDSRVSVMNAANLALDKLGRRTTSLAVAIVPQVHNLSQVLNGLSAVLGDTPLFGFSTPTALTDQRQNPYAITVALISGEEISARAGWWAAVDTESRLLASRIVESLQISPEEAGAMLLAGSADQVNTQALCVDLTRLTKISTSGCLSGGDSSRDSSYQIGGRQGGENGVAAAVLHGRIVMGAGAAHGWQPVGAYFKVTQADGARVQKLDDRSPDEVYAEWFGQTPQAWRQPPLNELVRIYPLGMEQPEGGLQVRAPLRVEDDGSLLMNPSVPTDSIVHWMIGSGEGCLQAAEAASQQAVAALKGARPVLGLVFADLAYQRLLEARPGAILQAVRQVTGDSFPLAGGYSMGQIARLPAQGESEGAIRLYNQHIIVMLLGEKA